jgi:predicted nucleic acid-binding protein
LIAFVDTNILIRHLTNDPPDQARRATSILENAERLILTDVVVAELVYVLESHYEQPRKEVAQTVQSLLALPSIALADHDLVLRAIELYEHARLDFAEAYLVAAAELSGVRAVASFDRTLDRVDGLERIHRSH